MSAREAAPQPRDGLPGAWSLRGLILAAGIAAHASGLGGAFVFDDVAGIVARAEELSGPLPALLGDRRPLVTLSLALNHALGGLDPLGYHAFNLLVHLAAALVLFELIRRAAPLVTGRGADGIAVATALLWAVHPLGTESVTYVIQRSESMAALCVLLMLLGVVGAARSHRSGAWALLAIGAAVAGMASKATAIAGPPLALLLDGLVLAPSFREAWRRRWGLHLALAATAVVLVPTGVLGAVFSTSGSAEAGVGFSVATITPLEYLRTQGGVVLHYARLAAWPSTLCIDPAWPVARTSGAVLAPAAVVAAALLATLVAAWRRHALALPALAFFVLLAPTSSFVPIRDLAAEHRMYLPLAALLLVVVAAVEHGLRAGPRRPARAAAVALLAVVTVALGLRTAIRNRDYATPVSLWSSTVAAAPHNPRARMNLGVALREAGRNEEAVVELARAVEQSPHDGVALLNYGAALAAADRPGDAIDVLRVASARLPDRPRAALLLGDVLRAEGRTDEAVEAYRRAYDTAPEPAVGLALGNALCAADRLDEAERTFRAAADGAADASLRAAALFNLGNVYFRRQQFDLAIDAYRAVLAAAPDHDAARHWLGEAERRRTSP